jgi:hypothetical protein
MVVRREDVEAVFDVVPSRCTGEEVVFICPQPGCGDSSGNRAVNLKSGKTNCFRCGVGGDFFRWAKRLGITVEAGHITAASAASDLLDMLSTKSTSTVLHPVAVDVRLPRGSVRLAEELDSAYAKLIRRMAIVKRLDLEDMVRADVHFTRRDPRWDRYAIFPVYEWERLVFYQGRSFSKDPNVMGKLNPSREQVPFSARYWVYNIDAARRPITRVVIVVESILNCLSLQRKILEAGVMDVAPVAVFKHVISTAQLDKILALRHVNEVCLMYDADATKDARKQALNISARVRRTVAVMPWTPERPTLDPNDDVDLAWQAFLDREEATQSMSLLATTQSM